MAKSTSAVKKKRQKYGGGSRKGIPNRTTSDVRQAIALVLQQNTDNFRLWLQQIAEGRKGTYNDARGKRKEFWLVKPDPGRALEACMSMAEYHIPKLARTEVDATVKGGLVVVRATPEDEAL